jgi:hypothetical protein
VSADGRRGLFRIRGRPPCRDRNADVPGRHDAATVTPIAALRPHEWVLDLHPDRTR